MAQSASLGLLDGIESERASEAINKQMCSHLDCFGSGDCSEVSLTSEQRVSLIIVNPLLSIYLSDCCVSISLRDCVDLPSNRIQLQYKTAIPNEVLYLYNRFRH